MSSINGNRKPKSRTNEDQKPDTPDDFPVTKKRKTETNESTSSDAAVVVCSTPTLYVSNLHHRVAEPHLEKLFQRFGEINRVNMIRQTVGSANPPGTRTGGKSVSQDSSSSKRRHRQQQPSRFSYAFVEFKYIQAANQAMNALNGVTLLGKDLVVKPAHTKSGTEGHSDGSNGNEDLKKDQLIRQEVKKKNDVDRKIDALKRALKEKQGN